MNRLVEKKKQSLLSKFIDQFKDLMIIVLLAAAAVSAFIANEIIDAVIILFVVVVNAILGVIQENKAEKSLEALKNMSAPFSKVMRNGQVSHIKTEEIVPGDVVILEAGDFIPADMRLIEFASLKIEEAALTGESVPVEKEDVVISKDDASLGDRVNMAYSGSSVAYGRGAGVVTGTGMNTEVGKIAANLINRDFSTTAPLEKWTTDVSQFNLPWGKCYLSPILDMNTNEIISYDLSRSPNMNQISNMLKRAFDKFENTKGIIFHSDQGWQYQHEYYRNELKEHGLIQSMSRKGNCYDNCIMETFFGRLKNEMFFGHEKDFSSFEDFAKAIDEYIDYYNNKRIQSKTKWMPPVLYRKTSMNA